MKRLIKTVVLAVALVVCGGQGAQAGMPVIDYTHIATAILNTADQIKKWASYIHDFKEYYATMNAVYQGIKNWRDMSWLDVLRMTELPWFDNVPGIEDLRNIAGGVVMTVEELNHVFADVKWYERMLNDPRFARDEGARKRIQIMQKLSYRQMRRRMTITKAMKMLQDENEKLMGQLKKIQTEIETESKKDPASAATIMALNARIAGIQAKMAKNKDSLYAQVETLQQQEKAEKTQYQDEIQMTALEKRMNSTYLRDYWKGFLVK